MVVANPPRPSSSLFRPRAGGIAITTFNFGPLITGLYCFGLFLGTIYSVPPLRLKRSAIAAFLIIATGEPPRSMSALSTCLRSGLSAASVWLAGKWAVT